MNADAYQTDVLILECPGHPPVHVDVHFMLRGKKAGVFGYIQRSRNGALAGFNCSPEETADAKNFYAMCPFYAESLGLHLATSQFDAIVRVPSRYDQSRWLFEMASKGDKFQSPATTAPVNIGIRFAKDGSTRSGESGTSATQLAAELHYTPKGDEHEFSRVLIVDDSIASGRSIAVIIARLLDNGVPSTCKFTAACYFWAQP